MTATMSGIPTVVGNAGVGDAFATITDLAQMLRMSVYELQMDINNGDLPPLPPSTRMFGQLVFSRYVARDWVESVPEWRTVRKLAAAQAEQDRRDAHEAERERQRLENEWAQEQIRLRQQLQAERDAEANGEPPKDNGHVGPFAGGAV